MATTRKIDTRPTLRQAFDAETKQGEPIIISWVQRVPNGTRFTQYHDWRCRKIEPRTGTVIGGRGFDDDALMRYVCELRIRWDDGSEGWIGENTAASCRVES